MNLFGVGLSCIFVWKNEIIFKIAVMKIESWLHVLVFLSLCGCSGGGGEEEVTPPTGPETPKVRITLSCGIASRATETSFEAGDKVGLFVVNYNGSSAGTLQNTGNHADNVKFTYSSTWTPEREIYWKDETTKADFYCYYPYATITDVAAYKFAVNADQSTEAKYKASDFLLGKTGGVSPSSDAVDITLKHVFSCMQIKVAAGKGYTEEELNEVVESVTVHGVSTGASINLSTGAVKAEGGEKVITPWKDGEYYKALIVPQSVAEVGLIVVLINKKEYTLKKAFTFETNKRYKFTVTVDKTNEGINVGIGNWEEDGVDHGGVAE